MIGVLSVIASLLIIALIVCLHEGGHFLAAKAVGVPVAEFSIGFGPKLFSFGKHETTVSVRLLPLGGYVRFYGDDSEDKPIDGITDKYLNQFAVWKRAVIMAAGFTVNIISAILATVILLCLIGLPISANRIAAVETDSPALKAGIQVDDRIIMVDGVETSDGNEVIEQIGKARNAEINITVQRMDDTVGIVLKPFMDETLGRARVGITLGVETYNMPLFQALPISLEYVKTIVVETFRSLKMMVFGQVQSDEIYGVVGTIGVMSESIRSGLDTTVNFFILISANLAVMNALPIPGLDGSKLVFLLIEAVRGKPINPEREGMIHLIGFALILLLALILTYNDIVRLITGG